MKALGASDPPGLGSRVFSHTLAAINEAEADRAKRGFVFRGASELFCCSPQPEQDLGLRDAHRATDVEVAQPIHTSGEGVKLTSSKGAVVPALRVRNAKVKGGRLRVGSERLNIKGQAQLRSSLAARPLV